MRPGAFLFIHNDGRQFYAIVQKTESSGTRVRLFDFSGSPVNLLARGEKCILLHAALDLGYLVPLVVHDWKRSDHCVGPSAGRDELPALAERGPEQFQPYYEPYDDAGNGLWREHESGDEVVRDSAEHRGRISTKQRGDEHADSAAAATARRPAPNGSERIDGAARDSAQVRHFMVGRQDSGD